MRRKKILCAFLAAIMVLALIPATAFSAGTEPTGNGTNFFANGTPITITKDAPADAEKADIDGFTATGTAAYISWDEAETTKYIGVSSSVSVYGGADGSASAVTVDSTSITMTGGTVYNLYGGNLGQENKDAAATSTVTGNVDIDISGPDSIVANLLHGGGAFNTCVNGTATITITDADLTQGGLGGCYINGGVYGSGAEGTRDIENAKMITNAVVNNAVINMSNSKALLVGGGGSGSTKVKNA